MLQLEPRDVLACRLVCKVWSRASAAVVRHLDVPCKALAAARASASMASAAGGRCGPDVALRELHRVWQGAEAVTLSGLAAGRALSPELTLQLLANHLSRWLNLRELYLRDMPVTPAPGAGSWGGPSPALGPGAGAGAGPGPWGLGCLSCCLGLTRLEVELVPERDREGNREGPSGQSHNQDQGQSQRRRQHQHQQQHEAGGAYGAAVRRRADGPHAAPWQLAAGQAQVLEGLTRLTALRHLSLRLLDLPPLPFPPPPAPAVPEPPQPQAAAPALDSWCGGSTSAGSVAADAATVAIQDGHNYLIDVEDAGDYSADLDMEILDLEIKCLKLLLADACGGGNGDDGSDGSGGDESGSGSGGGELDGDWESTEEGFGGGGDSSSPHQPRPGTGVGQRPHRPRPYGSDDSQGGGGGSDDGDAGNGSGGPRISGGGGGDDGGGGVDDVEGDDGDGETTSAAFVAAAAAPPSSSTAAAAISGLGAAAPAPAAVAAPLAATACSRWIPPPSLFMRLGPRLRSLRLSGCDLRGGGALEALAAALPGLEALSLQGRLGFSHGDLAALSGLRQLRDLSLSRVELLYDADDPDDCPVALMTELYGALQQLPYFESLRFELDVGEGGTGIHSAYLLTLYDAPLSRLRSLSLATVALDSDYSFHMLAELTYLTALSLSYTTWPLALESTDMTLLAPLSGLRRFHMHCAPSETQHLIALSGYVVGVLAGSWPHLTQLHFTGQIELGLPPAPAATAACAAASLPMAALATWTSLLDLSLTAAHDDEDERNNQPPSNYHNRLTHPAGNADGADGASVSPADRRRRGGGGGAACGATGGWLSYPYDGDPDDDSYGSDGNVRGPLDLGIGWCLPPGLTRLSLSGVRLRVGELAHMVTSLRGLTSLQVLDCGLTPAHLLLPDMGASQLQVLVMNDSRPWTACRRLAPRNGDSSSVAGRSSVAAANSAPYPPSFYSPAAAASWTGTPYGAAALGYRRSSSSCPRTCTCCCSPSLWSTHRCLLRPRHAGQPAQGGGGGRGGQGGGGGQGDGTNAGVEGPPVPQGRSWGWSWGPGWGWGRSQGGHGREREKEEERQAEGVDDVTGSGGVGTAVGSEAGSKAVRTAGFSVREPGVGGASGGASGAGRAGLAGAGAGAGMGEGRAQEGGGRADAALYDGDSSSDGGWSQDDGDEDPDAAAEDDDAYVDDDCSGSELAEATAEGAGRPLCLNCAGGGPRGNEPARPAHDSGDAGIPRRDRRRCPDGSIPTSASCCACCCWRQRVVRRALATLGSLRSLEFLLLGLPGDELTAAEALGPLATLTGLRCLTLAASGLTAAAPGEVAGMLGGLTRLRGLNVTGPPADSAVAQGAAEAAWRLPYMPRC